MMAALETNDAFLWALVLLLLSIGGAMLRVMVGPHPADRMMGAQLVGTGGIAVLVLMAGSSGQPAILDVALLLALLAAFASVAFVKLAQANADEEEQD
jgi:multicomponent Na+:H+ antiporter subunit F